MLYPYENLENFTLPDLLKRSVSMYENNICLSNVDGIPMNYRELNDKVSAMVKLLQDNGIEKGDKVILLSENMSNWAVAYFSVTYFGAVIVPVLTDFHKSDVHHIIKHSEAKAAFVSEKHLSTIVECEEKTLKFTINTNTLELVDELTNIDYISSIKKIISKQPPLDIARVDEDDLAAILYTSGTTGHSKGVMLSHKNLVTNALSSYSKLNVLETDSFLSILPLAHTFECTVGLIIPILHGSSVYYIDKAPTPSVLVKALSIVRPTMLIVVPLIIEKIYKTKILAKFNSSFFTRNLYKIGFFRKILNKLAGKKLIDTFGGRLRFMGIGGAPLSTYVEKFLLEANFPYVIGYGLTETAPLLAATVLGDPYKIGSTGSALAGVELKIKDKDHISGEGEIIARSPSVMLGYYKDKEKTDEVMEDGWFLTGDLGHIDDEGFLFISGRSKNVIVGPSGENIYPEQIESIINQHEAVLDSLVMQKDGKIVARVHLDYELIDTMFDADNVSNEKVKEEIENLLEDMRVDVNSKVSSFSKMVKFIEQIEPFIKTPTKKIKRYLYTD